LDYNGFWIGFTKVKEALLLGNFITYSIRYYLGIGSYSLGIGLTDWDRVI